MSGEVTASAQVIPIDPHSRSLRERGRCRATTAGGRPCRNTAVDHDGYCRTHSHLPPADEARAARAAHPSATAKNEGSQIREPSAHRSAESDGDDLNFDEELFRDVLTPLTHLLYRHYFRVQTRRISAIPDGGALLVCNHSGMIAWDALMVQHAVAVEHSTHRVVRSMVGGVATRLPVVGSIAAKSGNALDDKDDAVGLLRKGHLVAVFPEGDKGVGKSRRERYRIQPFNEAGVALALEAGVPVVPVAIVGAEDAYPKIGNLRVLARLLRLSHFPLTPTWPLLGPIGLLPLPSRWIIEFGDPLPPEDFRDHADENSNGVFHMNSTVRNRIKEMFYENLWARRRAYF